MAYVEGSALLGASDTCYKLGEHAKGTELARQELKVLHEGNDR